MCISKGILNERLAEIQELKRIKEETVDKTAVKLLLSDEQYLKVSKVSTYQVLRIS